MIQPKFEIGQKVVCVRVGWSEEKVACPDCLGTRQWTVSLPSGESFQHDCQTCRRGWESTGVVSNYGDHARFEGLTIGSVRINTAAEKPVSYMCIETGVGNGFVYDEHCMFATRAEAEAFASLELERVKGRRQEEELRQRKHRKGDALIYGKRKKKESKS